jgi:UDP-2-acetamido-2,6-beta-L-arabino-hexul-4-ose reductase
MGLMRALYSTYVSYLPADKFSYGVEYHEDARGIFVEMLKTRDSGQFSFFTALPGVTRGGHYHHTKTEKFMVIKGQAKFCFRHILTDEEHILYTSEESFRIVETAPGWSHSVTNVGNDDLVALIWANEIFSKQHPDTVSYKV